MSEKRLSYLIKEFNAFRTRANYDDLVNDFANIYADDYEDYNVISDFFDNYAADLIGRV